MKTVVVAAVISLFLSSCAITGQPRSLENAKKCGELTCDSAGQPITGKRVVKYPDGNLSFEANFKDGKREGLAKTYYINGNLWAETNYKNGKQDGLKKTYDVSGNLKSEANFKDGQLEGLAKTYHENGNLESE